MYIESQTKKLAQTVFVFSASSLCAIFLCMAVTALHRTPTPQGANFQVYTYQNPFNPAANASPAIASETKAGGVLSKLISTKLLLGLSGLGALWLVSTWFLQGRWTVKKRVYREAVPTADPPVKMNPLAVLPERVTLVAKRDIMESPAARSTVLCQTPARCSVAYRKNIAPCQSRFRPITLRSSQTSQTRFGRLS